MVNRRPAFFQNSLPSEKNITKLEAQRAIYIDFEGFIKLPPAMIGILMDDEFTQVILDSSYHGTLAYNPSIDVADGKHLISKLADVAVSENRKIVAFSSLEKEQCIHWYGIDISPYYVNAKLVAASAYRKNKVSQESRPKTLADFEKVYGFSRLQDTGFQKNTKCLRSALRDLEKYGELKNPSPRRDWTRLLKHNRQDVLATKFITLASL